MEEHKIKRPHKATVSVKDVLFFKPPLEPRNPELVIHKHVAKVGVKDVL